MNNFHFLNLDIPLFKEEITLQDIPKRPSSILDREKYLNEKILMFFDSLDLEIFYAEIFFKTPKNPGGIHIDAAGGDFTKLNWVFGGGESKMGWYEPINKNVKPTLKSVTGTYISYTRNQVIEIENTVIKNPTLVQVGIPHGIFNVTEDRVCISILFRNKITKQRPTMNESVQIFKKYIKETGSE